MSAIRYPDDESVAEITAHYLLAMPAGLLPLLYGFRFDGTTIHTECGRVEWNRDPESGEPNPLHLKAAQLRTLLGPGMFGFGFVFPVFADQLEARAGNRQIPEPVRIAAEQFPAVADLIAAVTIDATGRQWWAVIPHHMSELDPVVLRYPAVAPEEWRIPDTLDASLWAAALALDEANHAALLCLRTSHPNRGSAR